MTTKLLFQAGYPATLSGLIRDLTCARAEIWSFDDAPTRRATETALALRGVRARCRSAYKPLLHAFQEEIETAGLVEARILCPCHPEAVPGRFLLEAYPLPALFPLTEFDLREAPDSAAMPAYRLSLGYVSGQRRELTVLAPNRLHRDASGQPALSPCGWLVQDGQAGPLQTECETIYRDALRTLVAQPWQEAPFFQELALDVTLPIRDRALPYGDEVVSLTEALHEDLYFSALEHFGQRLGGVFGDRTLRPGQIAPRVRHGAKPTLRIATRPWDHSPDDSPRQPLDQAAAPLPAGQIADALARLPGRRLQAWSVAGRPVAALYLPGRDRALMISAGQHANEVSGPVGALRAARDLARREGAHFTLCPLENPDGYALRQRLARDNPRHLLHAARYTALGDDLDCRRAPPEAEREIRAIAQHLSGALLHVSLHGYPAHEWTRPFSGYVPRGFADWTLPRGFFLVLRHHRGWGGIARRLVEAIVARLRQVPGLAERNLAQIALARRHGVAVDAPGGFPRFVTEDARAATPLTLLTEYPDETLLGEAFVAAHEAQRAAVIAAYEALQQLDLTDRPPA